MSSQLAEKIATLARADGVNQTPLSDVHLFRASHPEKKQPVVYDPCIVIVGQGQKCAFLGDQTYIYNPDNYLVMSVPMPLICEVSIASPDQPFLGICVSLDTAMISELLIDIDTENAPPSHSEKASATMPYAASASPMDDHIHGIANRLMDCLTSAREAKVLAPLYIKELLYRTLQGEQGNALRAVVKQTSRFHHIAKVMKHLQSNFDDNNDVETLAKMANMSTSSFHQHFKSVTSLSPVQYVKSIRLHTARSLILQNGVSASEAAGRVGYVSNSQFSREYKRFFGVVPSSDIDRLRA